MPMSDIYGLILPLKNIKKKVTKCQFKLFCIFLEFRLTF